MGLIKSGTNIISKAIITSMLLCTLTPMCVNASQTNTTFNEVTSNKKQNVEVTADVGETWQVKIPKSVTLSSTSVGSGKYTGSIGVNVQGDIALDKKITVETDETLSLTDSTGANTGSLTADLTINKTEFKSAELREAGADGIDTTHEIEADLTPGVWEGKQEFRINIGKDIPMVTFTLDGTQYKVEEGTTWGEFFDSDPNDNYVRTYCGNKQGYNAVYENNGRYYSVSNFTAIKDGIVANCLPAFAISTMTTTDYSCYFDNTIDSMQEWVDSKYNWRNIKAGDIIPTSGYTGYIQEWDASNNQGRQYTNLNFTVKHNYTYVSNYTYRGQEFTFYLDDNMYSMTYSPSDLGNMTWNDVLWIAQNNKGETCWMAEDLKSASDGSSVESYSGYYIVYNEARLNKNSTVDFNKHYNLEYWYDFTLQYNDFSNGYNEVSGEMGCPKEIKSLKNWLLLYGSQYDIDYDNTTWEGSYNSMNPGSIIMGFRTVEVNVYVDDVLIDTVTVTNLEDYSFLSVSRIDALSNTNGFATYNGKYLVDTPYGWSSLDNSALKTTDSVVCSGDIRLYTLIKFYADNTTYYAVKGMSWNDFVSSGFNVGDIWSTSSGKLYYDEKLVTDVSSLTSDNPIIDEHTYILDIN